MHKFDYSFLDNGMLPSQLVNVTASISSLKSSSQFRKNSFEKIFTELEKIAKIQSVNKKYFAAVSEIHVVPREYGNFELVLIPLKAHLRVLADRILDEDTLQKMMVTLDVVTGLDRDVDVIDLRYGSISYHSRSSK